jgi:hypothetical protein
VATLSKLVVGETTPEEAAVILEGQPYMRQNLPNGTIAWHWRRILVVYVGTVDNRSLVLQFDSDRRFTRVMQSVNVDLPEGMPFGSVVK